MDDELSNTLYDLMEAEGSINSAISRLQKGNHPARTEAIQGLEKMKQDLYVVRLRLGAKPVSWVNPK